MFRAFYLSSEYGRSKVEKILLTYQTFVLSQKVHTSYTTHPPLHNCVARLGDFMAEEHLVGVVLTSLTLKHSEWPKLYGVLAILSAIEFKEDKIGLIYQQILSLSISSMHSK